MGIIGGDSTAQRDMVQRHLAFFRVHCLITALVLCSFLLLCADDILASFWSNVGLVGSTKKLPNLDLAIPFACHDEPQVRQPGLVDDPKKLLRPLALSAVLSGDCRRSVTLLGATTEKQPTDRLAWLWLGDVYLSLGDVPQALVAWRQAKATSLLALRGQQLAATGDLVNAHLWVVWAYKVDDNPVAIMDLVRHYLRGGRETDAAQLLRTWSQQTDVKEAEHWLAVGKLAELDQNWKEVLADYQRGLQIEPDDEELLKGAKDAFERAQDWESAIAVTKLLLNILTGPKGWWMLEIGRYEENLQRYDEAIIWIKRAQQEANLPKWQPMMGLGRVYCDKGDFQAAMEILDKALENSPNNTSILFTQALCAANAGKDIDRAISYLEQVTALEQGQSPLYYRILGNWYVQDGRIKDAIRAYQRVIELDPQDVWTRQQLEILRR